MAVPTFVAAGTGFDNIAGGAVSLPAGIQTDDILLLVVETANEAVTVPTPNGGTWTQAVTPSGQGTAAATSATRCTVFWSRYNGTQGNPSISDSGDHQNAMIYAFRGVRKTGDPFDAIAAGSEAAGDTSLSAPTITTTVAEALVVVCATIDATQTFGGTWTNAALASITPRTSFAGTSGNDGRLIAVTGTKSTAGAVGNTTNTISASSAKSMVTLSLAPAVNAGLASATGVNTGAHARRQAPVSNAPVACILMVDTPGDWDVRPYYKIPVTVSNANWGNSTDMASIDSALAAWPQRRSVVVVAEGWRCVAALNWAIRHYEEVKSVHLRAPIMDLEERHGRVGGSEATSIENAYGGSGSWAGQMSAWNPGGVLRRHMMSNLFNEDLHVWRDTGDVVTPAAVTDAIAGTAKATLHTTLGDEPDIVPKGQRFVKRAAKAAMKRWMDWQLVGPTANYKAGDGQKTVVLGDGSWATFNADTIVGTTDADWSFGTTILVVRNSILLHNAQGVITGQKFASGSAGPAMIPNQTTWPSTFWWPVGACVDAGQLVVLANLRGGGGFGSHQDTHIVHLDSNFDVTDVEPLGLTSDTQATVGLVADGGFVYAMMQKPGRLMRCPSGQTNTAASWRWWDGSGWNASPGSAAIIQRVLPSGVSAPMSSTYSGVGGAAESPPQSEWEIRRWGSGWLALRLQFVDNFMEVYSAANPQGPYTHLCNVATPNAYADPFYGGLKYNYVPGWHPHGDTASDELLASFSTSIIGGTVPTEDSDIFTIAPHWVVVKLPRDPFA